MKVMFPSKLFVLTTGFILLNQVLTAQNSIQLFTPIYDRQSPPSAGFGPPFDSGTPYIFGSTTLSLTCGAGATASLSGLTSESNPSGKLMVDNNIFVAAYQGSTSNNPTNVCTGGVVLDSSHGSYANHCFQASWEGAANGDIGQNPDTFSDTYGVLPINIGPSLTNLNFDTSKPINLTISLEDEGVTLANSSIILTTSCTINGVTGPSTVGGNPINGPQGSSQTFTFNPNTGGQDGVQFGYDVTGALPTLDPNSPPTTAIPQVSDLPLDKTKFQPVYSLGTSFATSNCLIHNGEVLADGTTPACKLYTLACQSPTDGTVKGANCPVSSQVNEVVQDEFDGPAFSLQNIFTPYGIFRQGMGFLMASEPWTGGNCTFDLTSGLSTLACPLNLLTSFTGPGAFSGTGLTTNPNSTFLSIYGVPEEYTLALIQGQWPNHWVNTRTPSVKFFTQAPNFTKGAWTLTAGKFVSLPGAPSYVPAPIKSLTFGVSPANSLPNPISEPILGDITLPTSANCSAIPFTAKSVPNFSPAAQQLSFSSDGHFLLHYFAQDCAGTQELAFTQDGTGSWMTNFFTTPVNVDTQKPSVIGLTVPSPGSFKKGTTVYATYTCKDDPSGAGVVLCGTSFFGTETTYTTNLLKTKLDTSSIGTKSVTIYALDGAGNLSSASTPYTVTN
jgi:hypothetical protein